jgi:hypothetical protein
MEKIPQNIFKKSELELEEEEAPPLAGSVRRSHS